MPTAFELETLVTKLTGDNSDLVKKLKESEDAFKNASKIAQQSVDSLTGSMRGLTGSAVALGVSLVGLDGGLLGVATRSVKLAADAETLKVAFEVMTGSAERADKTLKGLYAFAANTPFSVSETVDASRKLLAAGVEAEDLVKTMKQLGDVAAGVDKPLGEIAYTFTSIKSQGVAFTQDIREFTNRGIPFWLALAKVMRLVSDEAKQVPETVMLKLRKMVEDGRINFDVTEKAFAKMTQEGGQFFGMIDRQNKTLKGLFNNLTEEINLALKDVGEDIAKELHLKEVMKEVSALAKSYKDLDKETRQIILATIGLGVATTGLVTGVVALKVSYSALTFILGTYITKATAATVATMGLYGAAIVAGGAIAYFLDTSHITGIGSMRDAWKELNAEIERSNKLLDERGARIDKRFVNEIETSKSIVNVDERRKFLADRVAVAQKEATEQMREYEKAEERLRVLMKDKTVTAFDKTFAAPKDRADIEAAIDNLNHYAVTTTKLKKGLEELRKEQDFADKVPGGNLGNLKAFTEEVEKLKIKLEELGKTDFEKTLIGGKRVGMNNTQLETLKQYKPLLEARKIEVDLIEEQKKKIEELKHAVDSLNKSIYSEVEMYKDLSNVQKVQILLDKISEEARGFKTNKAFLGASTDDQKKQVANLVSARDQAKELMWLAEMADKQKLHNKTLEEAKQVIDSIKTPLQKYKEQQAILNRLFDADYLSWTQYSTAMDKAEKEFKDATNAANNFRDALLGIDAVLSRSAEAAARVRLYKDTLRNATTNQREWLTPAPMPRAKIPLTPEEQPDWLKMLKRQTEMRRREQELFNNTPPMPRGPFDGPRILRDEGGPFTDVMNRAKQRMLERGGNREAPEMRDLELVPMLLNNSIKTDVQIIDLLTKIAGNTLESALKEGVTIAPAELDR